MGNGGGNARRVGRGWVLLAEIKRRATTSEQIRAAQEARNEV